MKKFIDLHCHPAMKALGHSFKNVKNPGVHTRNTKYKGSIWFYQPARDLTEWLNRLLGLTKFRQADFTSYMLGGGTICVATLYPLEKQFTRNQRSTSDFRKIASNLATGLSKQRISYVQQMKAYFPDMMDEYNFYCQRNNEVFTIQGRKCRYFMVDKYSDIVSHRAQNEGSDIYTIYVFLSIEGAQVFDPAVIDKNQGDMWPYDAARVQNSIPNVKKNIDVIMGKEFIPSSLTRQPAPDKVMYRPKFITFAHHFANHLCGHAKSLSSPVNKLANQRPLMNAPFMTHGKDILRYLIESGLIIDIKHMSSWARSEYYEIMESEYPNQTTIVSHGAVNGKISFENQSARNKKESSKFLSADINFYDEEIVYLSRKGGIFGIQMDERRIASKSAIDASKVKGDRNKKKKAKAKLLWNQLKYMAELLDQNGLPAWDLQAIGSDHDGIVDPVNFFWGSENIPDLQTYLLKHAREYMTRGGGQQLSTPNQLAPEEIIEKFAYKNAEAFMEKHW